MDLEKICREMGVEVKTREMRRLKAEVGSKSDTAWIGLESEEDKRGKRIWEKNLKGNMVWINEYLT